MLVVLLIMFMWKSPTVQLFQADALNDVTGVSHVSHASSSVDGAHGDDAPISMFLNNTCAPECCPGEFACSHGCVCTLAQMATM